MAALCAICQKWLMKSKQAITYSCTGERWLLLDLLFFRGPIKCRRRTRTMQLQQNLRCQSLAVFGLWARLADLMVFKWHRGFVSRGFCWRVWPSVVWMSWRIVIPIRESVWRFVFIAVICLAPLSKDHGCNVRSREFTVYEGAHMGEEVKELVWLMLYRTYMLDSRLSNATITYTDMRILYSSICAIWEKDKNSIVMPKRRTSSPCPNTIVL